MYKLCEVCQRFFTTESDNVTICSACQAEYNHNRTICRDYLRAHAGATLAEVSRATGLPIRKIRKLIEDGALEYQ